MRQRKISYQEVIFASCRKGIDAPNGGFCVKTHTEGMASDVLAVVASPRVCYYDAPKEDMPTLTELREDSSWFFKHPATWLYAPVTIETGRKVYVLMRSVFVGVEYGFFDGSGQQRQGSNFVAHALVFDEPIPVEIMGKDELFVPVSRDGAAYMEEMRELLCGEPVLLPPGSMEIEQKVAVEETGEGMKTLKRAIEALSAEEARENEQKKLIVKVESARTEGLIREVMRSLPEDVAERLFFTTNYCGDGLPYQTPIKMFFVNETYPERYHIGGKHIFVDLMGGANEIAGIELEEEEKEEEPVEMQEVVRKGWLKEQFGKRMGNFKVKKPSKK